MTTVYVSAEGQDAGLAASISRGLERLGRGRTRTSITSQVTTGSDPDQTGIDTADWFVLLASPESARSDRVGEEIHRWVARHGAEHLLPVLTAGTWHWAAGATGDAGDMDLAASSAAHPALAGVFTAEPRHLDLSWVRTTSTPHRDPRFDEALAELGAPVLAVTKDELVGEDVRRQRRTVRLTRLTSGLLALLTVLAVLAGVVALSAAADARREEDRAVTQRKVAEEQRNRAERERAAADSRRLASLAQQVRSDDGSLGRLLAVAAYSIARTDEASVALQAAAQPDETGSGTDADAALVRARLVGHDANVGTRVPGLLGPRSLAFSPDGATIATTDTAGILRLWQVDAPKSPVELPGLGRGPLVWTRDGSLIGIPVGGMVLLVDPVTGKQAEAIDVRADRLAPWGEKGFAAAGKDGVAVIPDATTGGVGTSASTDELGFSGTVSLHTADDDSVIVVGGFDGEVLRLGPDLGVESRWTFDPAADLLYRDGAPDGGVYDQVLDVSADGAYVLMPPDGRTALGATVADGALDPRDNAIAGVYRSEDGTPVASLASSGYVSAPAVDGRFVADGPDALAVSPLGFESAPSSLAGTVEDSGLGAVPLPVGARLLDTNADGSLLVLGGDDSGVLVVERPGATQGGSVDAVEAGCRLAGRNLSEVEWSRYLPDREYLALCDGFDAPFVPDAETAGPGGGDGDGEDTAGDVEGDVHPGTDQPFADVDFANASYDMGCLVGGEVALRDGTAFDTFGTTAELVDTFFEDMTGDGVPDAVVHVRCLIATGVWQYVVVVDGDGGPGQFEQISNELMTREVVRVEPGRVVVREPDYGPDDPQCCPSGFAEHTWVLEGGSWVER